MKKNIHFFLAIVICLFVSTNIFSQNKKLQIDRKQFVGNYKIKTDVGGGEIVAFPAAVKLVKGKLAFIVSEGGSMQIYYEETSVKEIQKTIEYHFEARNLDMDGPTTFRFKKKGNRYELTYDFIH
jgi:hypothetical protein